MKSPVLKICLFVALLFMLVACAPASQEVQTSTAVQIPEVLKLAISSLLLATVTLGLQALFDNFGLDLRGVGAAIAVSLSGFAIAQLQGIVDVIPTVYDQLTTIVLNIMVVILSGVGVVRALFHRERAAVLFSPRLK